MVDLTRDGVRLRQAAVAAHRRTQADQVGVWKIQGVGVPDDVAPGRQSEQPPIEVLRPRHVAHPDVHVVQRARPDAARLLRAAGNRGCGYRGQGRQQLAAGQLPVLVLRQQAVERPRHAGLPLTATPCAHTASLQSRAAPLQKNKHTSRDYESAPAEAAQTALSGRRGGRHGRPCSATTLALAVGQRKEPCLVRLRRQRLVGPAHERVRRVVVQQSERMAQLLGDDVAAHHRIAPIKPPRQADYNQVARRIDARQGPRVGEDVLA